MTTNNLNVIDVIYDDKNYGQVIDPAQWNDNFKRIENNINNNVLALVSDEGSQLIGSTILAGLGDDTAVNVYSQLVRVVAMLLNRYTKSESDTLLASNTNNLVKDVDVNLTTGVITITKKDNTVATFDTALEKVPATFEIIESAGKFYLKITNVDGTTSQTDLTNLMDVYNYNNTATVSFVKSGTGNVKTISAVVRDASIGFEKLSLSAVSQLEGWATTASNGAATATAQAGIATTKASEAASSASNAATSASTATTKANEASGFATAAGTKADQAAASATTASNAASSAVGIDTLARSYAVGGTGTRPGEDTDNAKFYKEQAANIVGGDYATKTELSAGLALKVNVEVGKGLSTENYTTTEKAKLAAIQDGAEVNVNADWNAVSGDAQILNKPDVTLLAPKANPTFTGTVTLPATTSVGNVSSTELGYLDGVTGGIQGQLDLKAPKRTPLIDKTASFTLALTDEGAILKCTSASTITVTIPLNSVVALPVGSEIVLLRYGAGAVTVAPGSATLYSSGSKKSVSAQYEMATLKKIATDTWVLIGSLA